MRIYLFNDTSAEQHAGCEAVMESLGKALAGHQVVARNLVGERFYDPQAFDACDAVLVNGEGTLHHGLGAWLLEMLALGQSRGKRTLLVNALFQNEPPFFAEVLRRLDYFSVREPRSMENARLCGGNPELLLDSCVGANFDGGKAMPGITGLVKGDTHAQSPAHGLLDRLTCPHFGLRNSFRDFVATMRRCSVYITGQHHAIYGCGLAGVPFVALTGNSHKIEGLLEWSGLPIPMASTLADVYEQIEYALSHREVFAEFQEFLLANRHFRAEDLDRVLASRPAAPKLIRSYDESCSQRLIGATQFFRNRPLFRTVLEQVDEKRSRIVAASPSCSMGCEVYSLAIAWRLFFQGRPSPELKIYATDRSTAFLEQAQRAVYPSSVLEAMTPEERAFFEPISENEVCPREEIRAMVEFLPPASFTDFDTPEPCDLVFLLNSLLYVSATDQARTLDRVAALNPGLLMITGAHTDRLRDDLTRNGYSAVTRNLEDIYYSWGDRFSLPPGFMIEGVTHYTPALGPIGSEPDADYRYCSIFEKQKQNILL
jgi:chemotaxis methyl-accepting protein methylase